MNVAFVLAATDHGPMIVNRHDYRMTGPGQGFGVGWQLLGRGAFDPSEVELALRLLRLRRQHHGDGVVGIDCGANIGAHALEWSRTMRGWGNVIAIEAQERLFYALAGNLAINNCANARAVLAAVGAESGALPVPVPNYDWPGSFGSLELKKRERTEYIGQTIDYRPEAMTVVPMLSVDSLGLPRADLIKIDVEGMEAEVLAGAAETLATHRPALMVELIKSDGDAIVGELQAKGYRMFPIDLGAVAIHGEDPILEDWT